MIKKTQDRRVQRTRNMLFDALIDLMIEKGYEAITIQDIVNYANIGRSTFYLHFADKEQLLVACIDQLYENLKHQSTFEAPEEYPFTFSLAMFQHVQSHKRLYKALAVKKGGSTVNYHMQRILSKLADDNIAVLSDASLIIPRETVVDFVVNTFVTLLTWWMVHDMPCSAMEVNRLFHKLTLSGLKGFQ